MKSEESFRIVYGDAALYPDLYVAAKLFVHSAKIYNKMMKGATPEDDDLNTLLFYTVLLVKRSGVSVEEVKKTLNTRDDEYNSPYACRSALTALDFASFLVAKALRIKNIYQSEGVFDVDNTKDFVVYAYFFLKHFMDVNIAQLDKHD